MKTTEDNVTMEAEALSSLQAYYHHASSPPPPPEAIARKHVFLQQMLEFAVMAELPRLPLALLPGLSTPWAAKRL